MKLLIITQKIDRNDSILGFFHKWVEELARYCESVIVVCLQEGQHNLPQNVRVLSLGKEKGASRLKYTKRFYKHIWTERDKYDAVFVHMNQEYIILGGLLWKLLGKKLMLWRNHFAGNFLTRIAMLLSDNIFCTSKFSFTALSKKTTLMPVGIDTELFKKEDHIEKMPHSVLFLGRIAPVKKPHLVIEALRILHANEVEFKSYFYGDLALKDVQYLNSLQEKVKEYHLSDRILFEKGIPHSETPRIYREHTVFINSTPSGSYDKTIFEAMACESLVLTSNLNLKGQVDNKFLFEEDNANDLARKLEILLSLDDKAKEEYGKILRAYVVKHHSLELLVKKLSNYFCM